MRPSTGTAAVGAVPSFSTSAAATHAWSSPPPFNPAAVPAGIPLVPTPEGRFAVVTERFYFELPAGWKAPVGVPGGATLVDGRGRSAATVAFHPRGAPEYEEPEELRRRMRSHGAIEDPPGLDTVTLSGRFGSRRRWTQHRYKGKWFKLGSEEVVLLSETLVVPDPEGVYLISFRSLKSEFAERRKGFSELLRSVRLPKPAGDPWLPGIKERRLAVPAAD